MKKRITIELLDTDFEKLKELVAQSYLEGKVGTLSMSGYLRMLILIKYNGEKINKEETRKIIDSN